MFGGIFWPRPNQTIDALVRGPVETRRSPTRWRPAVPKVRVSKSGRIPDTNRHHPSISFGKKTPNIRAAEGWGVCGKARLIIIPVEMVPEPNSLPSNKSGVDIATSFLIHAYYLYNSLWQFDAAIENHRFWISNSSLKYSTNGPSIP